MNKYLRPAWKVVLYIIVFVAMQAVTMILATFGHYLQAYDSFSVALSHLRDQAMLADSGVMVVGTALSSLFTIGLFFYKRWAPASRDYLLTRPWLVFVWALLAAVGTLIPSLWLNDVLPVEMDESMARLLMGMARHPLGYLVIGILVPVTEEVVFRGAILTQLLSCMKGRYTWLAIAISALIFAVAHGNGAQGIHAFLIGLLMGWMYVRTKSLLPSIVFHVANNTLVFVMDRLFPSDEDLKLIDLAGGNELKVALWLVFSLCILVPAIFQLHRLMKRA